MSTFTIVTIHGANLNLDDAGNITSVLDAQTILGFYLASCQAQGISDPPVVVLGA